MLAHSAYQVAIANVFGRHSDTRLIEALASQPQNEFDYSAATGDFWFDYTADIAKFDKPLLVIHCEDDQIVPIDTTGRRVPSIVPHAILKVYPGGAHGIAIVDPERVNADFLAFIKGEMKS